MRITVEQRGTLLPAGATLETLARCMGTADGKAFRDRLTDTMRQVRSMFLAISQRLSGISA
jgi:glutamine synthetase adenylyltransferase